MLGLSGGIDSALTLAIAVDALEGMIKVHAVMMPSEFTADISIDDSREMVNIPAWVMKKSSSVRFSRNLSMVLSSLFTGLAEDTTEREFTGTDSWYFIDGNFE